MVISRNCNRIVASGSQSQLRSIFPRVLAVTVSTKACAHVSTENRHKERKPYKGSFASLSHSPSIKRRFGYAGLFKSWLAYADICNQHSFPTSHLALNQVERPFSTAASPNFSPDEDLQEENKGHANHGSKLRMPRLQALRDRLRTEKKYGAAAPDVRSFTGNGDSRLTALAMQKNSASIPKIDVHRSYEANDYTDVSKKANNILTDSHGRLHNYLRISLSERCNLRCQYCMPPEGVPLSHPSHLLTNDEIIHLVKLFVKNGVNKVRLTGGEPLLRPDLVPLVRSISDVLLSLRTGPCGTDVNHNNGLLGITTNGISLSHHIYQLVDAGLTSVNISLDTLREDKFLEITRRKGLDKVLRAIGDTINAFKEKYGDVRVDSDGNGSSRVKINCVVMKGFNDDEMIDFLAMANDTYGGNIDMRFIEWMPFNDNGWNRSRFLSYTDMIDNINNGINGSVFEGNDISSTGTPQLERICDGPNDTTKWWRVKNLDREAGKNSRIGFITSMSEHFCSSCNRLRITADGKIKVCLFGSNEKEVSLRNVLRKHLKQNHSIGSSDEFHTSHVKSQLVEEELRQIIQAAVHKKTFALGGHGNPDNIAEAADNRPMTLIGG